MKYLIPLLFFLSITAQARVINFAWDPPVDPTGIDETRLYQTGEETPLAVVPMPDNTGSVDMGAMAAGTYCFYATFANAEVESDSSKEVCISMPEAPQNFTITISITVQ